MCDDGVLAVDNGRIVTALIEHTGINAEYVGKINGSVERAFIRDYDDGMIFVDEQVAGRMKKGAHELVMGRIIIEAFYRNGILDPRIVGVKCDKIGNAHIHQFFNGVSAVQ